MADDHNNDNDVGRFSGRNALGTYKFLTFVLGAVVIATISMLIVTLSREHNIDSQAALLVDQAKQIEKESLQTLATKEKEVAKLKKEVARKQKLITKLKESEKELKLVRSSLAADRDSTKSQVKKTKSELDKAKQRISSLEPYCINQRLTDASWVCCVGRAAWKYLHTVAAKYPEHPTEDDSRAIVQMFESMRRMFPCEKCRNHLDNYLSKHPPDGSSHESLSLWLCKLHNVLNKALNKPHFECDVEVLDSTYLPEEVCNECQRIPTNNLFKMGPKVTKPKPKTKAEEVVSTFPVQRWVMGEPVDPLNSKHTLLFFFTPKECSLCLQEIPEILAMHARYSSKGIQFIGVTKDMSGQSTKELSRFLEDQNVPFSVAVADFDNPNYPYREYMGAFRGVPCSILLERSDDGKSVTKVWDGLGLEVSGVETVLAEKYK